MQSLLLVDNPFQIQSTVVYVFLSTSVYIQFITFSDHKWRKGLPLPLLATSWILRLSRNCKKSIGVHTRIEISPSPDSMHYLHKAAKDYTSVPNILSETFSRLLYPCAKEIWTALILGKWDILWYIIKCFDGFAHHPARPISELASVKVAAPVMARLRRQRPDDRS